jgi:hypothetical protein
VLGDVFFQLFDAIFSVETRKVVLQLQQNVINGADLVDLSGKFKKTGKRVALVVMFSISLILLCICGNKHRA